MPFEIPIFLLSFFAGIASFFSPCILPLVPAYICFVTGFSIDELTRSKDIKQNMLRIFFQTCLFALGFSFVFVLLGASASLAGKLLIQYQKYIKIAGGIIAILFGLHIAGIFKIKRLDREIKFHLHRKPSNLLGAFIIGIVFSIGWTPCVGPILGTILTYAASSEKLSEGVLLLSIFSLGLSIPFLICGLAINAFFNMFTKIRRYYRIISIISGIILIIIGLQIMFD